MILLIQLLLNRLIDIILGTHFILKLISKETKLRQNSFHYWEIHSLIHSLAFRKICNSIQIYWVNELLSCWLFPVWTRKVIRIVFNIFSIIFNERYFVLVLGYQLLIIVCIIDLRLIIKIFDFILILIRRIFSLTTLIYTE